MKLTPYDVMRVVNAMRNLTSPPGVGETVMRGIEEITAIDAALLALQEKLLDDYGDSPQHEVFVFDVEKQASRLAWTVVARAEVKGDGVQAPGYVTLCMLRRDQYVIHFFNAQDGGFHDGDYCSRASAFDRFALRADRFTRHHQ